MSSSIKKIYIILSDQMSHNDESLIADFQLWRKEQRVRDAALRASALRRLEQGRERYHRNRDARLAYAKEYYVSKKAAAAKNAKS